MNWHVPSFVSGHGGNSTQLDGGQAEEIPTAGLDCGNRGGTDGNVGVGVPVVTLRTLDLGKRRWGVRRVQSFKLRCHLYHQQLVAMRRIERWYFQI